jgi:DNA-binding IclR family transcriptional regulator
MSIRRAMQIIERLARHGPHSVRGLSRDLGVPLGSTHRMLADLEAEGVVERTAEDRWELSYRLLQLVGIQYERIQLPQLVRPVLEQLAAETRETAFLAIPVQDAIVYLDKVQSDQQMQLFVELGTRRPMHCTGLGKAILAFLPQAQRERYLATARFEAMTPNTITDPVLLALELERTRERGYATDREEILIGVHCIAVPLINYAGRAVGAISIAGATPRIGSERFDGLVRKVTAVGQAISMRLGYNPAAANGAGGERQGVREAVSVGEARRE